MIQSVSMATSPDLSADTAQGEKSLSERAYKRLRDDVLAGVLEPGEKLRMNVLQQRYGMGLSPLREALLRLSSEGLVRSESQRGFEVAPVSVAELQDLTRARICLDTAALAQAMHSGDADWEARIVAADHLLARTPLPDQQDDLESARVWEERHRAFHQALIAGSGSEWLVRLHNQLVDHSERYRKTRLLHHKDAAARVRNVVDEHREITDAVLARDVPRATALLTAHLQATADAMAGMADARKQDTQALAG